MDLRSCFARYVVCDTFLKSLYFSWDTLDGEPYKRVIGKEKEDKDIYSIFTEFPSEEVIEESIKDDVKNMDISDTALKAFEFSRARDKVDIMNTLLVSDEVKKIVENNIVRLCALREVRRERNGRER